MAAKKGNVKLSVFDGAGKLKTSVTISGERGLNQFRWDLVTKTTESLAPYFINYKTFLRSGKYRIQLESAGDFKMAQEFNVVDDSVGK